jgi:hypothetical protein
MRAALFWAVDSDVGFLPGDDLARLIDSFVPPNIGPWAEGIDAVEPSQELAKMPEGKRREILSGLVGGYKIS